MARPSKLTKPRKSTVSLADIARVVGCTPASVSLVFNDSPLPSKRMRENVMKAATQLGYIPNRMAQSLQRGRTYTLGAVMPYCSDHLVSSFLDAASLEATEFGFEMEIHFHRWSAVEEERILNNLAGSRVEGVILYCARDNYRNAPALKALRSLDIPVIGHTRVAHPEFDTNILIDRVPGAFAIGRHLAELGHRRVDYFEPSYNRDSLVQAEGLIQSLMESLSAGMDGKGEVRFRTTPIESLPGRHEIEANGFSYKAMYQVMDGVIERYLASDSDATAIVVANTMVATRLLGMMRKHGLECPRDLSIIPFGPENWSDSGPLPMTALEYSPEFMARKAVASILAVKAGQKVARTIKAATTLVPRASTAPPRATRSILG